MKLDFVLGLKAVLIIASKVSDLIERHLDEQGKPRAS